MATIKYAVIAAADTTAEEPGAAFTVRHIYQHRPEADGCAHQYRTALRRQALVAEMKPALAVARRGDMWAVPDWETKQLHLYASREEAQRYADQMRLMLIETPIRMAMPVQQGVPQFGLPSLHVSGAKSVGNHV